MLIELKLQRRSFLPVGILKVLSLSIPRRIHSIPKLFLVWRLMLKTLSKNLVRMPEQGCVTDTLKTWRWWKHLYIGAESLWGYWQNYIGVFLSTVYCWAQGSLGNSTVCTLQFGHMFTFWFGPPQGERNKWEILCCKSVVFQSYMWGIKSEWGQTSMKYCNVQRHVSAKYIMA